MRPLIVAGFYFFSFPAGEILRGKRFAQWVLGEDPCAGVAELPFGAVTLTNVSRVNLVSPLCSRCERHGLPYAHRFVAKLA